MGEPADKEPKPDAQAEDAPKGGGQGGGEGGDQGGDDGQGEGGGIMGYVKKNGMFMAIVAGLALLGLMLGGPLVALLALLLGGGALAASSGLFGEGPQNTVNGALDAVGLGGREREPEPLKTLPVEVALDGTDPTKSTIDIDGRKYEVTSKFKAGPTVGNEGKALVESISYKLADDPAATPTEMKFVKPVVVGENGPNGVVIDEKLFKQNIAEELAKDIRKAGKKAVTDQKTNIQQLDEDTYMVRSENGKKAYTVDVTEDGFKLKNLDGTELKTVSGIGAEALKGGMLAREIGQAIQGAEASQMEAAAPKLARTNKDVDSLTTAPADGAVESGAVTFKDGTSAEFTLTSKDGTGSTQVVTAVTMTRNSKEITIPVNNARIGSYETKADGESAFVPNEKALKTLLRAAATQYDERTKPYENLLTEISDGGKEGSKYLLQSQSGSFVISISEDDKSYETTNLATGEKLEKGVSENKDASLRSAIHQLIDEKNVSPVGPTPGKGIEGLALGGNTSLPMGEKIPTLGVGNQV